MKPNWYEFSRAAGRSLPHGEYHPSVREWIAREDAPGRVWAIAVSGGADSLFLLLTLFALFPDRRERIRVLHFDHCLRGAESAADAEFVQEVAAALGLDFRKGEWTDRPAAGAPGEAAAREARLAFFKKALADCPGPALFLGHQQDDILETQLMRLCRGSGASGLSAPRPVGCWGEGGEERAHLRPLLCVPGGRIREILRSQGIPFREDASNATGAFFRNRLRLSVIPALREAAPADPGEGAARAREVLEEEDAALGAWLREILPPACPGAVLRPGALVHKPRALWRRALEEWLSANEVRASLSLAAVDSVLAAWQSGSPGRFSAGADRWLVASAGEIRIQEFAPLTARLAEAWPLPAGSAILFPGCRQLTCRVVEVTAALLKRLDEGTIDPARESFLSAGSWSGLRVRQWRAGDRFRPLGAPGERKLQDWFTDRQVPREERLVLPVVFFANEGDIAWVPGFPPAEARRITPDTKQAVWLTYRMPKPA